jgi:hypothetical protein
MVTIIVILGIFAGISNFLIKYLVYKMGYDVSFWFSNGIKEHYLFFRELKMNKEFSFWKSYFLLFFSIIINILFLISFIFFAITFFK